MINNISSNYHSVEHIFMVPKIFEPLKFYCMKVDPFVLKTAVLSRVLAVMCFVEKCMMSCMHDSLSWDGWMICDFTTF